MTTSSEVLQDELQMEDLSRQKSVFSFITLSVLAMLLLLHTIFASILGEPSPAVIGLLGLAFALTVGELTWLRSRGGQLTERAIKIESCISIAAIVVLTALLAYITNRDESPYFVLLAIPILQCAYVFGLLPTVLTIVISDGMILFWLWRFFALHPPPRVTQYLEGGMLSVIYILIGLLVWPLVNRLKANQLKLSRTLRTLQATRERLITEEKLAAVGRLASGIAHEIRNPVAMISTSLATAADLETEEDERKEMFAIAARESKRLEYLTADFLAYARPSTPKRSTVLINDLLSYIAGVTKAHAATRSITISSEQMEDLSMDVDVPLVEGALLNLALNAIDATPEGGTIKLRAALTEDTLCVEIEDSGPRIPESTLVRIFEPFFTTKPAGTGLGLAIARSAARSHGGDLWLSNNQDGCVRFSMTLNKFTTEHL